MSDEEFGSRMAQGEDPYALVAEEWQRAGRFGVPLSHGAYLEVELNEPVESRELDPATVRALQKLGEEAAALLRGSARTKEQAATRQDGA